MKKPLFDSAKIVLVLLPSMPLPIRALVMVGQGFRLVRKNGREIYRESLSSPSNLVFFS